ncbi:MAG: FAD-binding protein [Desulfobacterales bacterium]|nr:FAD-binding protein [Desulfobacterales bacterium]MCP4158712.1 FAD-binding protein [Deltaproteobacteria bacterium]
MYDITIIGAGPAGSTLARLLSVYFKVLLVEKRDYEKGEIKQEKCCGGLLAPDAQKILAKLGLGLPKDILSNPQLFSVCAIDFDNKIERNYQRHYINMDREKFDSWLISLIPDKAELLFGYSLKEIKKEENFHTLKLKSGNDTKFINTKIVVGADGAYSKVRQLSFNNVKKTRKYIAVQEWYKLKTGPAPCFYSIFDSEISDFYSWMIQKENSIILGSALDPKDNVTGKFELLKERVRDYGIDIDNPYKKNGTYLLRPQKSNQLYTGKEMVALIGEAAGWISPSSAEGLSYSMESALMLSESIKKDPDNFMTHYQKATRKLKYNIFLKNCKSHLMYNRFTRGLIMKSGVLSFNTFS